MGDRPDGAELLKAARALLLDTLLPALPENRRYEALMVASAMAIAAREMAADTQGDGLPEAAAKALAAEIRAGRKDADSNCYESLLRETERRLGLSNPKLLAARRGSKAY